MGSPLSFSRMHWDHEPAWHPSPCPLPARRGEGGRRPGEGWFMESPLSFFARIGTMNQIGTPLPALCPQGGERVAEGPERGGSWRASFRFCARIGTVNHPLTRPPATLSPIGGEGRGEGEVHGKPPFAFAHALGP